MTYDKYIINEDGTADVIIFSNWLIAYLRLNGYDFGSTDIKIVKNPYIKDRDEFAFVFRGQKLKVNEDGILDLEDSKLLELMDEFYNDKGLGGFLVRFRSMYRDTMDLVCSKKRLSDDCYAELKIEGNEEETT